MLSAARVTLLRPLARRYARRFGPALAEALITRSHVMGIRESSPARAAAAAESEELCRRLDREQPGRRPVLLARALVAQAAAPGEMTVAARIAKASEAIGYVGDCDDRAGQVVLATAQGVLAALLYRSGAAEESLPIALQARTTWQRCGPRDAYERMGLARTLAVIGDCRAALGHAEEALTTRQEAMALYRALPLRSRSVWTWTGNLLAIGLAESLRATGQPAAAIAVTDEVRGELEFLARIGLRPRQARIQLGDLLTVVAWARSDLGEADAARQTAEIAVDHWRAAFVAHKDADRAGLARALLTLGTMLTRADRPVEASDPLGEAIRHARGVDDETLTTALLDLAGLRLAESDWTSAKALLAEAVPLCRRHVEKLPALWSPRLVRGLALICGVAAFDPADLDEAAMDEAVAAGGEAVTRSRQLAAADPAHRMLLAGCLFGLERLVNRNGDPQGASELLRECVAVRRELFRVDPARHRVDLAQALNNLGNRLHVLDRLEEAADAHRECVEVLRSGAADVDRHDLPTALRNLARTLDRSGRADEAGRLALEADEIESPTSAR